MKKNKIDFRINRLSIRPCASCVAACLLSTLFAIAILGKVANWTSFLATLEQMHVFRLLRFANVWNVGSGIIIVETLLAIGLLINRTRRLAAAGTFIVLNIFLIVILLEKKNGEPNVFCPCFGNFRIPVALHVTINILGAALAMWLFATKERLLRGRRTLGVSLCLYGVIVASLLWPSFQRTSNSAPFPNQALARAWLLDKVNQIWKAQEPLILIIVNLTDLNCLHCANSIDQFLNFVANDSILCKATQLIVTSPDTLYGQRRATGWLKAQKINLRSGFVPYQFVETVGIHKSGALIFNQSGNFGKYVTFPYPSQKLIAETQHIIYE